MDEDHDSGDCHPRRAPRRGRGAVGNPAGRFQRRVSVAVDDGWETEADADAEPEPLITSLGIDRSRTVISYNRSPDIPFDRSVNPYRGCEHGCIYCYARPSHAYLDLSPGLDFESRLLYKPDAAEQLADELAHPRYRPRPMALGVNTDAWQPVERRLGLTRRLLQVLLDCRHPVTVITKSGLIERDLDLLAELAQAGLVTASVSVTTLDDSLNRRLEPRAAGTARRLRVIRRLAEAGVPVGAMVAPVIPGLTDAEMEHILVAVAEAGACSAGYILLRLPHEVEPLFREWLAAHYPGRAGHVMSLIQQIHGGRSYDTRFGHRMRGQGPFADLLARRFRVTARRLGLDAGLPALDCERFRPPERKGQQLSLL